MLQIIRLARAEVEPAPVSIDRDHALDHCLRRAGCILFRVNVDVWGIPVPMAGEPFLVARRSSWTAGVDFATVWLQGGTRPTITLYDCTKREIRRQLDLPRGFRLVGVSEAVFGLVSSESGGLHVWAEGSSEPRLLEPRLSDVPASAGSRLCGRATRDENLLVVDIERETTTEIQPPSGARWTRQMMFSPSGSILAAGLDNSLPFPSENLGADLEEILAGRGTLRESPHRLALIDEAGRLTVADGHWDDFAYPMWSNDGEWIVFKAPAHKGGLWLTSLVNPRLHWLPFHRNPPRPLVDLSDLLP
jgi:hypothetical protein